MLDKLLGGGDRCHERRKDHQWSGWQQRSFSGKWYRKCKRCPEVENADHPPFRA